MRGLVSQQDPGPVQVADPREAWTDEGTSYSSKNRPQAEPDLVIYVTTEEALVVKQNEQREGLMHLCVSLITTYRT